MYANVILTSTIDGLDRRTLSDHPRLSEISVLCSRDDVMLDTARIELNVQSVLRDAQSLVVESKQVQNGGVQVVHRDDVFNRACLLADDP